MNSTHRRPSGASNRTAATRSASCAETTNPPSSTAAALSGCDSIVDAIWSSASSSGQVAPTSVASSAPATTPATVAAADEPSPRDSGMALSIVDAPADRGGPRPERRLERGLEAGDEPVRPLGGQLPVALAAHAQRDRAVAVDGLDANAVHEVQREPEAVVAGAQVGR